MQDTEGIELKAFKDASKTLKLQNLPKTLAQTIPNAKFWYRTLAQAFQVQNPHS